MRKFAMISILQPILPVVAASVAGVPALRVAEQAGLTVIVVARPDGFEVFTRPRQVGGGLGLEGSAVAG